VKLFRTDEEKRDDLRKDVEGFRKAMDRSEWLSITGEPISSKDFIATCRACKKEFLIGHPDECPHCKTKEWM
jgi:hypothetical protein